MDTTFLVPAPTQKLRPHLKSQRERKVGPDGKVRPWKKETTKKGQGPVIHKPRLVSPAWTLFLFLSKTEGVWDRAGEGGQGWARQVRGSLGLYLAGAACPWSAGLRTPGW